MIRLPMQKYSKKIVLILLVGVFALVVFLSAREYLSFEAVRKHSDALAGYVERHYLVSVVTFAAAVLSTSFLVPGALILTVTGGFLFGAVPGAFYASFFSTIGAVLAFLMSRYFIGDWIQKKYSSPLKRFNQEISRHGQNYLFVLRVIPFMPAFVVNYAAGLTRMSAPRFAVATFFGMFPGAFIYSMAGRQLHGIQTPGDLLSARVVAGFALLAFFALLPVLYRSARHTAGRRT